MSITPDHSPEEGENEGTIDPELTPYLEAARDPAEDSPAGTREAELDDLQRRETEDSEALRLLADSGLLGDISVLEDEADEEDFADALKGDLEDDPLQALAATSQAQARMDEVYQAIISRAPEHEVQPSLDRVAGVLELLGDPHKAAPVIHIAGTNGKTSTARMVEELLRARGLRTGRFTSPHLHSPTERIVIDGAPIDPARFVAVWEDVEPYIAMIDQRSTDAGGPALSFFEVFTIMAFAAFADAPVDVVVLEVGMGGRWDATNVAEGTVNVITPISRDHTRWLGETLAEIAGEKAGIVTEGSTVILGPQEPEVADVLMRVARDQRAHVIADGIDMQVTGRSPVVGGQLAGLQTPAAHYADVIVPLHGAYQASNALAAVVAVESFFGGGALDGLVLEKGMSAVTSPGRLEIVRSSPLVIVDAAHNPGGMAAVREAITEVFDLQRVIGVVGAMADKDVESMFAELEPLLDEVVITDVGGPRAADVEDLAQIARDVFDEDRVHVQENLAHAIDTATTLAESGMTGEAMTHETPSGQVMASAGVLVVGSVILAGQAREVLGKTR